MSLDYFKEEIRVWAVEHHWRPDQIQYAEDYIDDLYEQGAEAALTSGLDKKKADHIKDTFNATFPKQSD